jgi:O-antigen/teichoic acid export membrane protein
LVVAVVTTPWLVAALGVDRWGVFTLALSLVGIFGIFDLGVGRALTRGVAERLGAGKPEEAVHIAWTGLVLIAGLGVCGACVLAALVTELTQRVLVMPPSLHAEVARALYVLCFAVPLAVVNAGLWGILAACQRFRGANLVNLPVMCGYYVGPLCVLLIWNNLSAVIATIVVCRLAMTFAYAQLVMQALPSLRQARFAPSTVIVLLRLGGWMTLSNLMQPLLLYLDRFVVASMLSVAATAYYATPYDLATRAWLVPVAIMGPVFPAISAGFRASPTAAIRLYQRAIWGIAGLLILPCLALVLGSEVGLKFWLGPTFAERAAPVLAWLGVGLFFSCAAYVPSGLVDAIGRPDWNAKLSIIQALVYVPLLWLTIRLYGIEGAAIAWTVRAVLDCGSRLCLGAWLYPPSRSVLVGASSMLGAGGLLLLSMRLFN